MKVIVSAAALLLPSIALAEQYDPAAGLSPVVLLQSPSDPAFYYRARERAKTLYKAEEWAKAEPLLEELTRMYPRDPDNWRMLARTKRRLDKFAEAGTATLPAQPVLGLDYGYLVALSHLKVGNERAALDELRRTIFDRRGIVRQRLLDYYPDFAPLKDNAEFRQIVGMPDTNGWTRQSGWAHDLEFFYNEVKRVNPDYRDEPFPREFDRLYSELRQNVPNLADEEIFVGLQKMLAVLQQGHLTMWATEDARTPNRFLPLQFYVFPDGLYVIDAAEPHSELIGTRVDKIGDLTASEALRRHASAMSVDGPMGYLARASDLAETYYLKGLGATADTSVVDLSLTPARGPSRRVRIETAAKQLKGRQDKLIPPKGGASPPLSLKQLDEMFWHKLLPEHDALYVQINNLLSAENETLSEYGERLWSDLLKSDPKSLIVDVRHNNGGATQDYPDLLRTLIAFSRLPGKNVYVLIGRRTYSAAGNFVTDLERLADPVFIGEPTGECCNFYGDPTEVTLPYSRVQGELTAMKWNLSTPWDLRRELVPDVPVQLTAKEYFSGEDSVLQATLSLLQTSGRR